MVFCPSPKKSGPDTELLCCLDRMRLAARTMPDHAPVAVPALIG